MPYCEGWQNRKNRGLNIRIFLLALDDRSGRIRKRWRRSFPGVRRKGQQFSSLLVRLKILLQLRKSCQHLADDLLLVGSWPAREKRIQVRLPWTIAVEKSNSP